MNDSTSRPASEAATVTSSFRPLRIWPALLLVGLMVLTRFGPAYLEGGMSGYWWLALAGPLLACLLLVVWWLAFSRATRRERLFGLAGIIVGGLLTGLLLHPTMRGPGITYVMVPMGMIAFALGAALVARQRPPARALVVVLCVLGGFGFSLLLRNEGMTGAYELGLHWRWSPTAESFMLARRAPVATNGQTNPIGTASVANPQLVNPEWPGFRGTDRASRAAGPPPGAEWSNQPPRQIWKIQVGPAWSSFAVAGNHLFTQEQRGPLEAVVCYDATSGRELWEQTIEARFDEPLGGPGPRATPTLDPAGLFVTGPSGIFRRLDPQTGRLIWRQDLKEVAQRVPPMWGFSASPLVVGSNVLVHAGGAGDKGLLAFDLHTGTLRWSAPAGDHSYSSPQLNTIAGEAVVLMLSNEGLTIVNPTNGLIRLNYAWKAAGYRALQPHVAPGDVILLPTGMNAGTRAIRVSKTNEQMTATDLWTSRQFKLDFTDFVTHQGYAYGADGGIYSCLDLQNGSRLWKGGRYGQGQVLLLENLGWLLIAAEDGRVVLLRATPKAHIELGSFQALEGKTWNHPVVVGNRLYIRNAQEAACYELPL
jgi:outer membrane protein assembly factor BamB